MSLPFRQNQCRLSILILSTCICPRNQQQFYNICVSLPCRYHHCRSAPIIGGVNIGSVID